MTSGVRALVGAIVIGGIVLVADQLTKRWAIGATADGPIDLWWTLRIRVTENTGMAFSQGQGWGSLIGVVAIIIAGALLVVVARRPGRLNWVGVGLIVGGALGNVADRLTRSSQFMGGGVVDFIDLQWFPVFNVADMAINVGAVVVIVTALLQPSPIAPESDENAAER